MPIVSVIIPTYKHQDLVLATLDSVFAQTFTDYEVIVVNDGSPDDTAAVLKPLADAGRIRYIEQENQGQAAARNRGIAEAQGEFVALLDDDDLWPPDKLEWQVEALRDGPDAVMVYGYSKSFGQALEELRPEGEGPNGEVIAAFLNRNWITSPGQTLIRKDALETISGFDSNLWGLDDWDLYIRLAGIGSVLFAKKIGLNYRLHSANASNDFKRMHENGYRLADKHRESYTRHKIDMGKRRIDGAYAAQCVAAALTLKRNGKTQGIRPMLWTAARVYPSIIRERCFAAALIASFMPAGYLSLIRILRRSAS